MVATQLVSPLLWDHYAMLLLLPVAWLLERRQWWAVAIPLATSVLLTGIAPPAVYPVVFAVAIAGLLIAGRRSRVAPVQSRSAAPSGSGTRRPGPPAVGRRPMMASPLSRRGAPADRVRAALGLDRPMTRRRLVRDALVVLGIIAAVTYWGT